MDVTKNQSLNDHRAQKLKDRQALSYPFTPPLCDAKVVYVAKGVLWARLSMPMGLDHINVYILEDTDGWYLVDTGLNTEENKALWIALAENYLTAKPVKGVICTHFHYDHSGLSSWLTEYFDVPLYMTHGEYYMLRGVAATHECSGNEQDKRFYTRSGFSAGYAEKVFEACKKDPYITHYPPHFFRLREGDVFTIGQRKWQVWIGEGHSPEHACLYSEAMEDEPALLISGDQVLPEISSNILVSSIEPEGNPLAQWFKSLKRLESLDSESLVLPAHGPVFGNLHIRSKQLEQHHKNQLDVLRELSVSYIDFTALDALEVLFKRPMQPIEKLMALGETLAHLNWLINVEELTRTLCNKSDKFIYNNKLK
ncbi:beta-lactamase domain protein [Shewanella halifaxensis HAW-EB4]|uniref:Beta-lactamase domain protein n=1 Tax=Shewanella halifaxensis (strain HAW-EB4) TaxID=458817 RepID=B0TTT6_SHEHH|nr:MBL fold metallo-hydrolase [Shewanella halifaxensis]ABZ76654.1 beta-lactamase domain protein [Shewanella halifaxensis HAW-EB4]